MGNANIKKLEDRAASLLKEANAYKQQSYEYSDLLFDVVPTLSRLGYAASPKVLDAALELARVINKNPLDVGAIRGVADSFLGLYQKASDTGQLQPHDTAWHPPLVQVLSELSVNPKVIKLCSDSLLSGAPLEKAFRPLIDELKEAEGSPSLSVETCEHLAAAITELPLGRSEFSQAVKLSRKLRSSSVSVDDLEQVLSELAVLMGYVLQNTVKREGQMQNLVVQMSGELRVVDGFLRSLSQREDASLAEALLLQAEVGRRAGDISSVFEQNDSISNIKTEILSYTRSMRDQIKGYVDAIKTRRREETQESSELLERLSSLESELQSMRVQLEEAKEEAACDCLTGLYNRGAFERQMDTWLAEENSDKDLCCIIWDVDFFKKVNDTYGHVVGDDVLCGVSEILKNHTGSMGMAARLGGEEFVTVIIHTEIPAVMVWAENVRVAIATKKHDASPEVISVSVSCGIAEYREGDSLVSILTRADKALYQAKDQGRNRCVLAA